MGKAPTKAFVLLAVLLVCCARAFALDPSLDVNQYAHTSWKIRDGFTKGTIRAIAQTSDGYLWLGTELGLLRFDGVRAVPWQPPMDQHLPSSDIWSLLAARDGTLWIGTAKGLADWKGGKLTQFPELAGQYVNRLVEDHEGTVWAGGIAIPRGRLCAIQKSSVECHGEDGSLGHGVFGLYEDSKSNLWVGVLDGLWRWKPGPPHFYPVPGSLDSIRTLSEDNDGALLISTRAGIGRFVDDGTEPYSLPRSVPQFHPERFLRDREGGLWIGTGDRGLLHVHQGKTDMFRPSDGLSGDLVTSIFEDRESDIWVATLDGLDRFRNFAVTTLTQGQGLSDAAVESVLASGDGSVWIGTDNVLDRWNNGQITTYDKRKGKLNGLAPNSLFQDTRGRIWVSTMSGFGYVENGRFLHVSGVAGSAVHSVAEDNQGNLWIADQNLGLFHLLPGNVVQEIPWSRLGRKDHATALAADPSRGGLWLGFFNGGVAYFAGGEVQVSYSTANGLGEGLVNDLRFDQSGTLWAATEGGLSRFEKGHFATLTSKNGLPCDSVYWSIEDDDHSFWLYMPCGLVRIARSEMDAWAAAVDKDKNTKRTIQATVFDSSDGVRSISYTGGYTPHVAKSPDGRIWFAPHDDVSVIDPHHIPFNKLLPPVHVEKVIADRKEYRENSPGDVPSNPHLPPLVRELEIDYTALSLVAPEKVLFRYKLEGWDRDWQDAGTRRQVFYTNLAPGKYRFRVIASNNSGVWNEAGDILAFSIAPAYYQTTWFLLSVLAAFFALLGGLYRLRLMQLAREFNVRVEERAGERTRIARELHDSLLQGFQGLMFRLQAVRDLLPGQPGEAVKALDLALEHGDKAIVEGRDTVSDLRESIIGDKDVADALTALGQELAAQSDNGTAPLVRVLVEGKPRELDPLLRDEVYRIGREALRNAFRHAKAQKIEAEITYGDSEFLLHVRDDGSGIAQQVANRGARAGHWGLPGMRERAKSFDGKLEVWSQHGAGTEIKLTVPASVAYGGSKARRRFSFLRTKARGNV